MPEMSGFEVLARLKQDPVTADIPVVVLTSKTSAAMSSGCSPPRGAHRLEGDAVAVGQRGSPPRGAVGGGPRAGARAWLSPRGRILNVDDYVPARYARSQVLRRAGYEVIEAGTGAEALRIVAEERPIWCCSTSTCRT
jgi:CheY-like chemotaxis protein